MKHFTIWIDADSCPTLVRSYVTKYAAKENLTVNFVANKPVNSNNEFPFNMIVCSAEKDAADNYILEHAVESDLVITRDIVFADKLVSKIPSIRTPLQTSILAGIMLCDELYKEKSNVAVLKSGQPLPPENNTDSEELERRTIAMIDKINKVL